jgi:hypothetical protein
MLHGFSLNSGAVVALVAVVPLLMVDQVVVEVLTSANSSKPVRLLILKQ